MAIFKTDAVVIFAASALFVKLAVSLAPISGVSGRVSLKVMVVRRIVGTLLF